MARKNQRKLKKLLKPEKQQSLVLFTLKYKFKNIIENIKDFIQNLSMPMFVLLFLILLLGTMFLILKPIIAQRVMMSASIERLNATYQSINFVTVSLLFIWLYEMIIDRYSVQFPQGGLRR